MSRFIAHSWSLTLTSRRRCKWELIVNLFRSLAVQLFWSPGWKWEKDLTHKNLKLVHQFLEEISIERDWSKLYLKTIWYYSKEVIHLKVAPYDSPLTFWKLKSWKNIKKLTQIMHIIFFKEGSAVQNQAAWHHSSQMKKHILFGAWVPEDCQVSCIPATLWAHLFTYLGSSACSHAAKALNKKQLM